jgi:release factor glutamine methyltransferase
VTEWATVADALVQARRIGVDRLDAQLLLAFHMGRPRVWLLAHDEAPLANGAALRALLERRAAGEPLAYLTGEREFHGLTLHVTPDVLVPRPDTETLVDWALELMAAWPAPRVADLGTGSGAIALALKHACARAEVHASDDSAAALAVARGNGQRLGLDLAWHAGHWWRAFEPEARFHVAVSNPPYIAPGDPHLAALRHEPSHALVAAGNGLADLEQLIAGASAHLHEAGWLLLEHGFDQAGAACAALQRAGFEAVTTRTDLAGQPRVSGGRRGAATP